MKCSAFANMSFVAGQCKEHAIEVDCKSHGKPSYQRHEMGVSSGRAEPIKKEAFSLGLACPRLHAKQGTKNPKATTKAFLKDAQKQIDEAGEAMPWHGLCLSPGNRWKHDKACACHRARVDIARLVLVTGLRQGMPRHDTGTRNATTWA